MILAVLAGTPAWVYVLFAYLMFMGLRRLRPLRTDVRRLWIAPVLFVVWGLSGLAGHADPFAVTLACWLLGAALGGFIGRRLEPAPQIDPASGRAHLPASAIPLLRNLAIFGAHYLLHVAAVLDASAAVGLLRWDAGLSGLGAGYFIGWTAGFVRQRRALASLATAPAARR